MISAASTRRVALFAMLWVLLMPALAWAQQVDLVANIDPPAAGQGGAPYQYTFSILNNGSTPADNSSFELTVPASTAPPVISCTVVTAPASCPPSGSYTAVQQPDGSYRLSATIPTLGGNNARLAFTVNGTYAAGAGSSATLRLVATPPPGYVDTNPSTNTSIQGVSLINNARVRYNKTVASSQIGANGTTVYTVTIENAGPSAIDNVALDDTFYMYQPSGLAYPSGALRATLALTSCNFHPIASAPTGANDCAIPGMPATKDFISGGTANTLLSGVKVPVFPAGRALTFTYAVSTQWMSSCQVAMAVLRNQFNLTMPPGVSLDAGSTLPGSLAPVNTTVAVENACAPPVVGFSKTAQTPSSPIGATVNSGEGILYTIQFTNNGSTPMTNVRLYDEFNPFWSVPAQATVGYRGELVSCAPNGAQCPNGIQTGDLASSYLYTSSQPGTVGIVPPGAGFTLTYRLTPTWRTQCQNQAETITNKSSIAYDAGGGTQYANSQVSTTLLPQTACKQSYLTVRKSEVSAFGQAIGVDNNVAAGPVEVDSTGKITYQVTLENAGPSDADGTYFQDFYRAPYSGMPTTLQVTYASCTPTGGATCPEDDPLDPSNKMPILGSTQTINSPGGTGAFLIPRAYLRKFPVGARVVLNFDVRLAWSGQCPGASVFAQGANIRNEASIIAPVDVFNLNPNQTPTQLPTAAVTTAAHCVDITTTKRVNKSSLVAGDTLQFIIEVENAQKSTRSSTLPPNRGVTVQDPFPDGFTAAASAVSCQMPAGTPVACTPSLSPDGRTLNVVLPDIAPGGKALVLVDGQMDANTHPGTYTNVATSIAPYLDPNASSNVGQQSYEVTAANADLMIYKTNTPASGDLDQGTDTLQQGGTTTYTLKILSRGAADVTGAVVKDSAGTLLTCADSSPVSCSGVGCPSSPSPLLFSHLKSGLVLGTLKKDQALTLSYSCNVN